MYTENGVLVDVGEMRQVVAQADVFAVGFRLFPERLLVDTRHNEQESPLVRVVEPVSSVQERFFWLGKERPSLGMPERFAFFVWPHSIDFLEGSGLWAAICQRAACRPDADAMCRAALEELHAHERQATLAAVRGERYHNLWAR